MIARTKAITTWEIYDHQIKEEKRKKIAKKHILVA